MAALLLVAACSKEDGIPSDGAGDPVLCALDGATEFSATCRAERSTADNTQNIVVRHPDGGFRRFEISNDGQNLLAADGADQSQSARKGDRFEVILGSNRYVIPVQVNVAPQ